MSSLSAIVILPANNEADYIGSCLASLLNQRGVSLRVIVSANACTDATVQIVQGMSAEFAAAGHRLDVIDSPVGGKLAALSRAEAQIAPQEQALPRVYLDADVLCDPEVMAQIVAALDRPAALYATGRLQIAPAKSWFTRLYGRFWAQLPFVREGAVGVGFFAVNAAGRARWGDFPQIISDDTFVRLQFSPEERIEVAARYHWPMIEGMSALVRVRRRQDAGVAELRRTFPAVFANDRKAPLTPGGILGLALRDPFGFAAYMAVHCAVRLRRKSLNWERGR